MTGLVHKRGGKHINPREQLPPAPIVADRPLSPKVTVMVEAGCLVTNDHSHGGHDEQNPDDGLLSPNAAELMRALAELGVQTDLEATE